MLCLESKSAPCSLTEVYVPRSPLQPRLTANAARCCFQWDLRFFSDPVPVCNVSNSNSELTVLHRYGASDKTCQILDQTVYNETNVKSISWKSPYENDMYDLCMFNEADCAESSLVGSITDGWEVCYSYGGWTAWSVVQHGTSCV